MLQKVWTNSYQQSCPDEPQSVHLHQLNWSKANLGQGGSNETSEIDVPWWKFVNLTPRSHCPGLGWCSSSADVGYLHVSNSSGYTEDTLQTLLAWWKSKSLKVCTCEKRNRGGNKWFPGQFEENESQLEAASLRHPHTNIRHIGTSDRILEFAHLLVHAIIQYSWCGTLLNTKYTILNGLWLIITVSNTFSIDSACCMWTTPARANLVRLKSRIKPVQKTRNRSFILAA